MGCGQKMVCVITIIATLIFIYLIIYEKYLYSWDNTQMYHVSIDDLKLWSKKGLKIIGGCCNTDTSEISRIRNSIDNYLSSS